MAKATLASAKAAYAAKIPQMAPNYIKGVSQFLGVAEGQISGHQNVASYRRAITPATADKWEANLRLSWGLR